MSPDPASGAFPVLSIFCCGWYCVRCFPMGSQVRRQSAATIGAGQIAGRQRCVPYPVECPVA